LKLEKNNCEHQENAGGGKILKLQASRILFASAIFVASSAMAQTYVAEGHEYKLTCNDAGYVLKSVGSVSRFVEAGADSSVVKGREKIFLGKSCDASHKLYGTGQWCWANGGFRVVFSGHEFGFPRQELYCEPEPSFSNNCNCQ
jgi:hypothetical protein